MTQAYKACKTPGISFKEHDTRKNGKLKDRYFRIRYRLNRRNITEALGWSTQGMTEQKASAILSQLKENIRLGKHPQTVAEMRAIDKQAQRQEEQEKIEVEAERITFSEVWKKYIEVQKTCVTRRHLSTEQSYYKTWIMPKLSKLKLTNITIDDVQNVISEVLDKRSPKTACHIRAIIRQVFNFAIGRELYYKKNPASEIKIKLNDNKRNRYLTLDEAKILLNELKKHSIDVHDIALIALYEGLRANEILSLRWDDINWQANYLAIMNTKNGIDRMQPLHPQIKEILLRRRTAESSGYVFKSRNGEKIAEVSSTFSRVVNALGFNKGITENKQKIVFHTLRHTYASWLVMNGVDLYTTQKLLGHKSNQMTQRYAHLAPGHLERAVNTLKSI